MATVCTNQLIESGIDTGCNILKHDFFECTDLARSHVFTARNSVYVSIHTIFLTHMNNSMGKCNVMLNPMMPCYKPKPMSTPPA